MSVFGAVFALLVLTLVVAGCAPSSGPTRELASTTSTSISSQILPTDLDLSGGNIALLKTATGAALVANMARGGADSGITPAEAQCLIAYMFADVDVAAVETSFRYNNPPIDSWVTDEALQRSWDVCFPGPRYVEVLGFERDLVSSVTPQG